MDGLGQPTVDAPINAGGATEKETADVSTATGTVAPGKDETASGSQDTAEGGKVDDQQERRRGPSKLDTIKELRAERRERDQQIQELRSQLDQLNKRVSAPQAEKKPGKTFWEAPEEVLEERLKADRAALRDEILEHLNRRDTEIQQTAEWEQEVSDATKFIETQKDLTKEDHEDVAKLLRSSPETKSMSPMQRAKYGLYLWKQERGIVDKTALKNKALSVSGSGTQGTGPKIWTNSEVEAKLASYPKDKSKWTKEQNAEFDAFSSEVIAASEQGRLK